MSERSRLKQARRWVVKIGSALLTDDDSGLNTTMIQRWVGQIAALRAEGIEFLIVSSGAVAAGMRRLRWPARPREVHLLQAAAAVGQMGLVRSYESAFARHDIHTAQILLTHADLANRERYLNARSALRALLDIGVVPVVNENDTVVTDEIQFGDNDNLAALVANLIEADVLAILTDQAGLFDADPRREPAASLISVGRAGDPDLFKAAGTGSALGRGGMITKLQAAEKAARSGTTTAIVSGREDDVLLRLQRAEEFGTVLTPAETRMAARKQWLAGQLQVCGRLSLDAGAARVIRESGRSLLPVGVTRVEGEFDRGDVVLCLAPTGEEVARGLVNYSAPEARRIVGRASSEIEDVLGYVGEPELIHRDNMVVFGATLS